MISHLQQLANIVERVATGKEEQNHALNAVELVYGLETKYKLIVKRWNCGAANWRDVSGMKRVAKRLREIDPDFKTRDNMTSTIMFAVKLKNSFLARDKETQITRLAMTKGELKKEFGKSANVIKVRVMIEEIIVAK